MELGHDRFRRANAGVALPFPWQATRSRASRRHFVALSPAYFGISFSDKDGRPARLSARGGVGAVMGAKKVKAVVVDLWTRPGTRSAAGSAAGAARKTT